MKGIGDYAVVYDISSDRERRRVEKVLNGFGFRGRSEQFGDLRQLFSVGLFGKSKIFSVGLGFSGEGCGKILLCVVQVKPSLKLIDIFSMDYYYPLR